MTTFAEFSSGSSGELSVWVTIEGVGPFLTSAEWSAAEQDDRYRFCNVTPAFGASQDPSGKGLWQETLHRMPQLMSENLQDQGGIVKNGSVTVEIVDVDDILTDNMGTDLRPVAELASDLNAGGVFAEIRATGSLEDTDVLFIANEAIVPTGSLVASPSTFQVRRGALGTSSPRHTSGSLVHTSSPFLRGRKLEVWLAPARSTSSSDARQVGTYEITSLGWDETTAVWRLSTKSFQQGADLMTPYRPRSFDIINWSEAIERELPGSLLGRRTGDDPVIDHWATPAAAPRAFVRVGEEVMAGRVSDDEGLIVRFRGRAGTRKQAPDEESNARQVMVADDYGSSFRYSPGPSPSTSRTSGTWIETQHGLRILLCILTSAYDPDAVYNPFNPNSGIVELQNFFDAYGNYSSLPTGYGVGVHYLRIHWESWLETIDRTLGFDLPFLVYGGKDEPFRKWAEREVLRPMGVHLVYQSGQLYCHRPRMPRSGEQVETITAADVLTKPSLGRGRGSLLPDWRVSRDVSRSPTALTYTLGPDKVNATARASRAGQPGLTAQTGDTVTIPVPGARPVDRAFWEAEALARIRHLYKPRTRVRASLNNRLWDLTIGSFVRVVLPQVPNMKGSRGIDALAQVVERNVKPEADQPLVISTILDVYSDSQVTRRVAPSAWVTGILAGSSFFVSTNRYTTTSDEKPIGDLPDSDGDSFSVGDVVQLMTADGELLNAGDTEAVTFAVGAAMITTGDFGGALAAGTIVTTAASNTGSDAQQERYAYLGGLDFQITLNSGSGETFGSLLGDD